MYNAKSQTRSPSDKAWLLFVLLTVVKLTCHGWRLKRGTEQVAERRNEVTEQLQIVEEPVMNGQRGTEMMNNFISRTKTQNGY